jgi:hypothetical protein
MKRKDNVSTLEIILGVHVESRSDRPPTTLGTVHVPDLKDVGTNALGRDLLEVYYRVVVDLVLEVSKHLITFALLCLHRLRFTLLKTRIPVFGLQSVSFAVARFHTLEATLRHRYAGDVGFEHVQPNPEVLARLMSDLDTPMEQHEAMVDAIDWLEHERFRVELEHDPKAREEWEKFLFATRDERPLEGS